MNTLYFQILFSSNNAEFSIYTKCALNVELQDFKACPSIWQYGDSKMEMWAAACPARKEQSFSHEVIKDKQDRAGPIATETGVTSSLTTSPSTVN